MIAVLRHPVYRRLFAAQVVALLGTGLATVALGLLAYDIGGPNAGQVLGWALTIKMLAYVFGAPIAGALLARADRRSVMVSANLVRLGAAACLPVVGATWQIYLLVLVLQLASACFTPTFQSVIPDVLTDEDAYTSALSLSRLAVDLESICSPLLAAVLLLVVPSCALFAGTAIGMGASALLVAGALIPPRPAPGPAGAGPDPAREPGFAQRLTGGLRLYASRPALRPIATLNLAVAAACAVPLVQSVVIVRAQLALPEPVLAWLLAALGAGSITMALALPRMLQGRSERTTMLPGVLVLAGTITLVPAALAAGSTHVRLALVIAAWIVLGAAWSASEMPVGRILRREAPAGQLPAAFTAQFSLSHACWLITYPLCGWLGSISLTLATLVLAGIAAAAAAATWALWPRAAAGAAKPAGARARASVPRWNHGGDERSHRSAPGRP